MEYTVGRLLEGAICILCLITISRCQSGASNMEFYVTIPGDKSAQKYTVADVVSNEAFKMICKYTSTKSSQNCAALWLYGSTDRRLAEMTGSTGKGKIGDPYQSAAVNRMNATFEGHSGGMRIELDVFKATRELFDFDSYYCRCVNINSAQQHVQLKIHDPTAPMNMEVYQDPGPPYLEGQTVRLKCLSEAWPSKTTYQILANQFSLFTQEVSNSRDGIEYSVVIDDAVHKNVECVATNKMGSNKKQYTMVIHAKPALSMSRTPRSDIRKDTKVTVECHSLVENSEIQSLSLSENGAKVKEVETAPFSIEYELLYTKERGLSTYECILKPKYYDDLSQTRTIDFIYGPLVSLTSNSSAIKQVEISDSFSLICVVKASSKLLTPLTQSCAWSGQGISPNSLDYYEVDSETLRITAFVYASMLEVGTYVFQCQCDFEMVQYETPSEVSVDFFSRQSVNIESSLNNGCYGDESFEIRCETSPRPELSNVLLILNTSMIRRLNDNPVEVFELERIEKFEDKPLVFDCELEYEAVTSTRRMTDSLALPKCELSILGLEPEYAFDLDALPSNLTLNVTISTSGVVTFYDVTWSMNDVEYSKTVSKVSENELRTGFVFEELSVSMHESRIAVQVDADSFGVHKKETTIMLFLKAKFFDTFDVQSEIGSRAKLVWNFMAFPFPVIGKITLRKDGFPLNYGQPPFTYSLKSINATQGSFELWVPVNSQDDYGSYSLNVTNNAGSNIHKIVLNYTVNPLLPTLIEFKPISPEETLIVWHMRDEDFGGRTDFFQLKTWDLDSGDPEPREDVVDASADQHDYSHKLTGLQLFGVYVTQLRSCNEDGLCSPWSEQQTLNLSDPQMFRQTEQETAARASAVLISFFVVIAVCTLLLLAAAIFICRKKCHEKKMNEQRQLPRYADGYASMPSRTVMRVPPPSSPGKQPFSTLDWCKLSVGSNTDTTSGYPFATMKNNHHLNDNSFVTFHGDPNDVTPDYQHETESEVLSPPLAIVDDEFHIEESPYSHLHHRINPQPHPEAGTHGLMTRISRTGNI